MTVKINYYPDFRIPADQAKAALLHLFAETPEWKDLGPRELEPDCTDDDAICQLAEVLENAYQLTGSIQDDGSLYLDDCNDENAADVIWVFKWLAPFVVSGGTATGQNWEDLPATNWRVLFLNGEVYMQDPVEVWDTPETINWSQY